MALIGKDLKQAISILRSGGIIAIPTETVYGLAGNANDGDTVINIYETKQRPTFNPLILHISSVTAIEQYAHHIPKIAWTLAEAFMPGPFTLLLDKKNTVNDLVTAGSTKVALRIPSHPLTLSLLSQLDFPLAAPSANPFGYISPTTPEHVQAQLGDKIPFILDGGACEVGIESTICGFDESEHPVIYRKGAVTQEMIEKIANLKVKVFENENQKPDAPGMLQSHYAPTTPLQLCHIPTELKKHPGKKIATLHFQNANATENTAWQISLSPTGDLHEAAKNLFAALRKLDSLHPDLILAETVPDTGIGQAINDRLKRAAHAYSQIAKQI